MRRDAVAERFRLLAVPARLALLDRLRTGPCAVGTLVAATGLRQANVSRHLQQLLAGGMVTRAREGAHAVYAITDPAVLELCDLVCARVRRDALARVADVSASPSH